MDIEEFQKFWQENFDGCPPLGYRLRVVFNDIWFRIHTLPNAKRYPEDESEKVEILSRHNSILDFLLREQNEVTVLVVTVSDTDPKLDRFALESGSIAEYLFSFRDVDELEDDEDPAMPWVVYGFSLKWGAGRLDRLLISVAEEELGNVLVVGTSPVIAYHPYDGGGDLIVFDLELRNAVREKFGTWLSSREDGL